MRILKYMNESIVYPLQAMVEIHFRSKPDVIIQDYTGYALTLYGVTKKKVKSDLHRLNRQP